jgi:hypothetical protein
MLAARLSGDTEACRRELARLSRFAAVAMAIVEGQGVDGHALHRCAPNVLIAPLVRESVHGTHSQSVQGVELPPWAQAIVCEVADPAEFGRRIQSLECPVIALRRLETSLSLPEARTACDRLQRDLAPHGDFAGYLV